MNAGLASNGLSIGGYIDAEVSNGEDGAELDTGLAERLRGPLEPVHQRQRQHDLAADVLHRFHRLER